MLCQRGCHKQAAAPGSQEVGNLVFKLGDMEALLLTHPARITSLIDLPLWCQAAAELYARALKVLERCEDS